MTKLLSLVLLLLVGSELVLCLTHPPHINRVLLRNEERKRKMTEFLGSEEAYTALLQDDSQLHIFKQQLDHFSATSETQGKTFDQRYWINDTYWTPGGPIFVQFGEEAPCSASYVNAMAMTQYGQKLGALLVAIEHRGYGQSNFSVDMSSENMALLSVDQGMADFANVITSLKKSLNASSSPVVVFGCSYVGAAVSWFRQRYGHLAVGAVASSAPVEAVVDFTQYLDEVGVDLVTLYGGQACYKAIQNATSQITSLLSTTEGTQKVETDFGVCKPFSSDKDIQTFWSSVIGNPWMGAAQYYSEGSYPPLQDICSELLSYSDPYEGYVQVSSRYNTGGGQYCLETSYKTAVEFYRLKGWNSPAADMRSWVWQTCSEFGYYQSTDSPNQPFGNGLPVSYYTDMCNDIYQLNFDVNANIANTNIKYGGQNLAPYSYTNVAFDGSKYGVWETLSPQKSVSDSVPLFLYESYGHCGGVFPLTDSSPSDVVQVHEQIFGQIQNWLQQAQQSN